MTKYNTGTLEKIIPCAKREFLDKGFERASMRTIAADAGIVVSGLYNHFESKEAMFDALVLPAVEGIKELVRSRHDAFSELPVDIQKGVIENSHDNKALREEKCRSIIDYIYDHYDAFKLLLTSSDGTPYANLVHDLAEIEVEYSLKFFEATGNDFITSGRCTPEIMHILSSALFSGIFEVVVHDATRQEAYDQVTSLLRFFNAGWRAFLWS